MKWFIKLYKLCYDNILLRFIIFRRTSKKLIFLKSSLNLIDNKKKTLVKNFSFFNSNLQTTQNFSQLIGL